MKTYITLLLTLFSFSSLNAQDWKLLGLENENITAIAVDWSNPDIIYAGSDSDFSAGTLGGIFKSINAGADWDTLIRGITVRDLDLHPKNPEIIYAALGLNVLTQPGIIKTTDAGNTWVNADSGITINWEEGPLVLEIDPKYPDTLYCGTNGPFGGKPYKSTNGGENWFNIAPYTPGIPTLCGDTVANSLLSGVTAIAIEPENSSTIYVGGGTALYKSTNGGQDWFAACLLEISLLTSIEFFSLNIETIYCGGWRSFEYTIGIFKTTDGGISWNNPTNGLMDTLSIEKIQIYEENNNVIPFIAGNWRDNGGIWKYVDEIWEYIGIDSSRITTITIFNEKLYAGKRRNGIYKYDIVTNVSKENFLPSGIYLYDNYPNPFNPGTTISYKIPLATNVLLEIFDTQGKKVKTLVDKDQLPGKYSVYWDGRNESGNYVSSGVYFYFLQTTKFISAKKMIYLR